MYKDKIKEQAIKDVVKRIYPSMSLVKTGITYTEACALVELCIQALPIEFVSRDSGDSKAELDIDILDIMIQELRVGIDTSCDKHGEHCGVDARMESVESVWKNLKAILRNNKPCVYIEDIGGSDDR